MMDLLQKGEEVENEVEELRGKRLLEIIEKPLR